MKEIDALFFVNRDFLERRNHCFVNVGIGIVVKFTDSRGWHADALHGSNIDLW